MRKITLQALSLFSFLLFSSNVLQAQIGETYLEFSGETGDYISGGKSYRYTSDEASFTIRSGNPPTTVSFSVLEKLAEGQIFGAWWSVDFSSVKGSNQSLQVKSYPTAQRHPFNDTGFAGFSLSGSGRGCNKLEASFTILELVLDEQGQVARFAADFEQHCEQRPDRQTPALTGKIRYNSLVDQVCYDISTDSDGDGVPDLSDACPETEAGVEVDRMGCSQSQFCSEIVNILACRNADFMNDKPGRVRANDCIYNNRTKKCVANRRSTANQGSQVSASPSATPTN